MDALLVVPTLDHLPALQAFFNLQLPEAPAGVRVGRRCDPAKGPASWHELEIKPGIDEEDAAKPVDGYHIVIEVAETGERHELSHSVGASGLQVQQARVGKLTPGVHTFTVEAYNLAGVSLAVSVCVCLEEAAASDTP